jgi:hypothetical protein
MKSHNHNCGNRLPCLGLGTSTGLEIEDERRNQLLSSGGSKKMRALLEMTEKEWMGSVNKGCIFNVCISNMQYLARVSLNIFASA